MAETGTLWARIRIVASQRSWEMGTTSNRKLAHHTPVLTFSIILFAAPSYSFQFQRQSRHTNITQLNCFLFLTIWSKHTYIHLHWNCTASFVLSIRYNISSIHRLVVASDARLASTFLKQFASFVNTEFSKIKTENIVFVRIKLEMQSCWLRDRENKFISKV